MSIQVNFNFQRNIRAATAKKLIKTSDGDTPLIEQPIRMVSCDTPEKAHYAGTPVISQPKLDRCKQKVRKRFLRYMYLKNCGIIL